MPENDLVARADRIAAHFPARLRELRLRARLSQSQVALLIGLPQSRVGAWETGDARCPWPHVVRLALALDVPLASFADPPTGEAPPPIPRGPKKGSALIPRTPRGPRRGK